jgi:NADH-quinone oxidoreductase subunit J
MLTAQGPFIKMRIGAAEWAIALAVGLVLYGVLAASLILSNPPSPTPGDELPSSTLLGLSLLGDKEAMDSASITGVATATKVPPRKPMQYLLPFEIVSVHLLVVLIGAAYLARAKRRRSPLPLLGPEQQGGASA